MLTLAVLLLVAGLISTFAFGISGYLLGPLAIVTGAMLYRRELGRRKKYAAESQPLPRRPGWKRFLIGVGGVVTAGCGLFAMVWLLTSGLVDTADGFLRATAAGDMLTARTFLAADWPDATEKELKKLAEDFRFTQYASASWTSRSIENSEGNLAGTVRTRSGGEFALRVTMIRENGQWKIESFHLPATAVPKGYTIRQPATAKS